MRDWLKEARLSSGMTMKQVADKLHISESYYCSIENGYRQRNMDMSLAVKISEALGISVLPSLWWMALNQSPFYCS